jgi:hypothetical protein
MLGFFGFFALGGLAIWAVWSGATVLSWGNVVFPLTTGLFGWYLTQVSGLYYYCLDGIEGYSVGAIIFMVGICGMAIVLVGNVISTVGKRTVTAVR